MRYQYCYNLAFYIKKFFNHKYQFLIKKLFKEILMKSLNLIKMTKNYFFKVISYHLYPPLPTHLSLNQLAILVDINRIFVKGVAFASADINIAPQYFSI